MQNTTTVQILNEQKCGQHELQQRVGIFQRMN